MFVFAFHASQAAHAEIITYDFSGSVTIAPSPAYGYTVPAHTLLQGQFSYNTASVSTTSGATSYYEQSLASGFTANFGSLDVSASSYEVTVSHDLLQPNGSYADVFAVSFASNSSPAPAAPLIVGGTAESVGVLSISFLGLPTLYPNSELPTNLSVSNFSSEIGLFSQTPTGLVDAIFSVTSVQAVPEPGSALLLFIGGLLALAGCWLSRRWRNSSVSVPPLAAQCV
jgi:hypothetical protein